MLLAGWAWGGLDRTPLGPGPCPGESCLSSQVVPLAPCPWPLLCSVLGVSSRAVPAASASRALFVELAQWSSVVFWSLFVTRQGPGPEWGPDLVWEGFTTQVQVTMRSEETCSLKLGTVKQGRARHRGSSNRRAQAGLPELTGKSEKRGLGDRFGGSAWVQLP